MALPFFVLHECISRFLCDVVNVCDIVKLAIKSYTKELHSVRKGDSIPSNTDGADCPDPVPGEHALLVLSALMLSPFSFGINHLYNF